MGGHLWVYLNWALGLRSLGYDVVWLEAVDPGLESSGELAKILSERLDTYGIGLALRSATRTRLDSRTLDGYLDLQACLETELLINMSYGLPASVVEAFRRSALVDIDPGLTQIWLSKNELQLAPHDIYFTIGETVGQPSARFPDCGIEWHYTPPCISLDHWPVCDASLDARFTTVSNWYQEEGFEDSEGWFFNDKRTGFLPYLDLPKLTQQPLELALCTPEDDVECWSDLPNRGWYIRDASKVTATPQHYQRYIQSSRGEFSCVKPSCIMLQNAWISDRTLCYLASGKPAVVQNTGPSGFLPNQRGLFRFASPKEAVSCLEMAARDYERQSRWARELAELHFDARKVLRALLERALA
jgi:hypothetical protein